VRELFDSLAKGSEVPDIEQQHPPREVTVPECYQVVVECDDEDDQRSVYEQMRAGGYRCRVVTL
jgi:hypothetical protein